MLNDDNITITKSERKTYSIEVTSKSKIMLRIPRSFTDKDAKEILEKHKEWIDKTLKRNVNILDNSGANKFFDMKEILFGGKWFRIKIFKSTENRIHFKKRKLLVFTQYPNNKEYLKAVIVFYLKDMARDALGLRIESLSGETGLSYKQFKISSAKKRWGSCSCAKNINLNWKLIMLDEKLSDSVIYHELCHTKVMNHSSNFYKLLKEVNSDYKFHKLELEKYSFILDY